MSEKKKSYGNQHTLDEELTYDYHDLVEDVRTLADELGHPPSTRDAVAEDRLPSIKTIYRIFDSKGWHDVLAEAGAGFTQVGQYGHEERPKILVDLRKVHERTETDHLTIREYQQQGRYNKRVVNRLFGTWKKTCDQANILLEQNMSSIVMDRTVKFWKVVWN